MYFPKRSEKADRYFGDLEFFFFKTEFTSYFMFNIPYFKFHWKADYILNFKKSLIEVVLCGWSVLCCNLSLFYNLDFVKLRNTSGSNIPVLDNMESRRFSDSAVRVFGFSLVKPFWLERLAEVLYLL